ncbi:transcriptional regulator [Pedobacter yulinensis]|uniref:Transcriptional regulator n=1 Tax=Pedobacter yulinensis TaxID=2126353 RepID=A0A2T3HLQ6_9SPHI|nr:metalloregulator ArsR/SmtB family transcription factor [Pedobacter yulinensis]PST83359.1 transcriptional regulator [Pedobacter yulinensis]
MKRDIFQAIADPARRAMILLIAGGTVTQHALAEHFDMSQQAVAKHIGVLIDSALVKKTRTGREVSYTLEMQKLDELEQWIATFRSIWASRFDQLGELLTELKQENP